MISLTICLNGSPETPILICVSPQWGSDQPDFRTKIRTQIQQKIGASDDANMQSLEDLSQIPHHPDFKISISHSPMLGGFALVESSKGLGFDLEVQSRVRLPTIQRMSSPEEISLAPSPAHLWSAKEAAFKSLWPAKQPLTLSEIFVLNWSEDSFEATTRKDNDVIHGRTGHIGPDDHIFAVALSLTSAP